MITAKIDVTKIDKAKLFPGKNGAKYLDIVLIETPDDKYGNDYMVKQGVSKEERAQGVKGAILGNAKSFKKITRQSVIDGSDYPGTKSQLPSRGENPY